MVNKKCQYCGKDYTVMDCQEHRSKFCSDACFRKNKNTQIKCNCGYCGKDISVQKSKYNKAKEKNRMLFCSAQCAKDVQKPKWDDIKKLFESKKYILISTEYINAKEKLEYICSNHKDEGSQYITYNNLRNGCGCKYCGQERTAASKRLSFDEVQKIFKQNDMILLEQEYTNTSQLLAYICEHHKDIGVQYMTTSNAYRNHCPYCHMLKGENKIKDFLLNNQIIYEFQKTYDDLFGVGDGKLSYDFYLPDYHILIEYNGEQHYEPVQYFGGEEKFKIQQEHDRRKREYAKQHKINLIEIPYWDIQNIDDILSNILINI